MQKARAKKKKNANNAKRMADSRARQKAAASTKEQNTTKPAHQRMAESRERKKEEERMIREEENLRASESLFDEETRRFESNLKNLSLSHCVCCWQVKIGITLDSRNHCNECTKLPSNHYIDQRVLPVWHDKLGNVHYELPKELIELTLGEKMLIQAAAPFVPLRHIWKDQVGVRGHVCSFPQSVDEIVSELPRLPSNVNVVRMIRSFKTEQHGEVSTKTFLIRKDNVLKALRWLVDHNPEYQHVTIAETNLNWMKDMSEAQLPEVTDIVTECTDTDVQLESSGEDIGPAQHQSCGYGGVLMKSQCYPEP